MSEGAFGRRGAGILAGVAAGSLAVAGFLGAFGDALYDPASFAPDSFSRSAVGHRAAVELLRGLGFEVTVSRHRTAERGGESAVVALLEPRVGPDDDAREEKLRDVDGTSAWLFVVLPKRFAIPERMRPRFVAAAGLLPLADAQRILDALEVAGEVVRSERSTVEWRGALPAPELDRPQLVASESLTPLLATEEGMLVGELASERGAWRTIVLADPDVLATHGLGRGANAELLVRLLERLGAGPRPVVVDETLHGFEEQPSLVRALLRFPLLLATASAGFAAALLAWAAAMRFGRPRPPEPALSTGKLFLVEATATLLRHGGHAAEAAGAYLRAAKEEVARRLRPPGAAEHEEGWLERIAAARGTAAALAELEERVRRLAGRRAGGEEAVRAAQAIHHWREEMTDGAREDPRHDRGAPG